MSIAEANDRLRLKQASRLNVPLLTGVGLSFALFGTILVWVTRVTVPAPEPARAPDTSAAVGLEAAVDAVERGAAELEIRQEAESVVDGCAPPSTRARLDLSVILAAGIDVGSRVVIDPGVTPSSAAECMRRRLEKDVMPRHAGRPESLVIEVKPAR